VKPVNLYQSESSEELRRKLITLMDDIYGRLNQVQDNVMDFNTNQVFQKPVSMAVESDEVDLDVATHEDDYDHSLLHGRSHAIDSSADHTSTIVENNLMDADSNGLPDDSGIAVGNVAQSSSNITDNRVVRGDGGTKNVQESGITCDDSDNLTGIGTISSGAVTVNGTSTIGDGGSTNYMEVSNTGDVVFVGGAGLAFGEIYAYNNSTDITLNSTGGKVQVTIFDTNGVSNNATPDHTNDHITITKAGMYLCTVSISVSNQAGASHKIEVSAWKNNGNAQFNNVHSDRTLGAGTDTGSITMSGIIDLAVNDTIEIWADTDRASNSDVRFEDITLSLLQIGGT
jgi:hypothetical protein